MTASGIDAQLGFGEETTYGTRVAPTRFYEFLTEDLKLDIDRIESKGIRAGRRTVHRWHVGAQRAVNGWEMEMAPQGLGLLLKHAFGAVSTAGVNPYTHTFTPGAIDGKSISVQVGRPDVNGVVRPFDYSGLKVVEFEIAAKVGELATIKPKFYGVVEDTTQALAVASYPTGWSPFIFTHGSLTIAGTGVDVKDVVFKGQNGLEVDRQRISATTPARSKEPKEAAKRVYAVDLVGDFNGLTDYNRFVNGTEAALVLTFNAGASAQLTITTNVRFDGETPTVGGLAVLDHPLHAVCVSSTSDAAAVTAALVNADSTP